MKNMYIEHNVYLKPQKKKYQTTKPKKLISNINIKIKCVKILSVRIVKNLSSYLYFSVEDITSNLILCLIICSIKDVLPNAAPGVSTPPL